MLYKFNADLFKGGAEEGGDKAPGTATQRTADAEFPSSPRPPTSR